jgi:hypothetical protein
MHGRIIINIYKFARNLSEEVRWKSFSDFLRKRSHRNAVACRGYYVITGGSKKDWLRSWYFYKNAPTHRLALCISNASGRASEPARNPLGGHTAVGG